MAFVFFGAFVPFSISSSSSTSSLIGICSSFYDFFSIVFLARDFSYFFLIFNCFSCTLFIGFSIYLFHNHIHMFFHNALFSFFLFVNAESRGKNRGKTLILCFCFYLKIITFCNRNFMQCVHVICSVSVLLPLSYFPTCCYTYIFFNYLDLLHFFPNFSSA